jgi:hypothetical protein
VSCGVAHVAVTAPPVPRCDGEVARAGTPAGVPLVRLLTEADCAVAAQRTVDRGGSYTANNRSMFVQVEGCGGPSSSARPQGDRQSKGRVSRVASACQPRQAVGTSWACSR